MNGTLGALAEPNRLRIVEFLRAGPRSVNEIVQKLALPQPLVSKHLRVLREAGVVQVERNAQQRLYKLRAPPFEELETWVAGFRRLWDERLDSLNDYMQQAKRQKHSRK
jgi:DNA-binding transcriptional ArsR family regulator